METINCDDLGIEIEGVPENMAVVINRDELSIPNRKKIFQFVLLEEVADNLEDILPYLADFDEDNNIVKPFMGSSFDDYGVFRKNLSPVYPAIYRKRKEHLLLIDCN